MMNKLHTRLSLILGVDEILREATLGELENWDSLAAPCVIARVREDYGVAISSEELARLATVADREDLVASKTAPAQ
jgi:acyl carrier protein